MFTVNFRNSEKTFTKSYTEVADLLKAAKELIEGCDRSNRFAGYFLFSQLEIIDGVAKCSNMI